jgi:hypothetical protein
MKLAIGSSFRNMAGGRLQNYVIQLHALNNLMKDQGHQLRWIAVEGDSIDETEKQLRQFADQIEIPLQLVKRDHGGPVFGSTEAPERMKALSFVGDGIFESIREDDDALIYVESDLVWRPQTFLRLVHRLSPGITDVDMLAPLIFAGECFYDIWGFRKDGIRFGPFPPFHHALNVDGLTLVDSVGSCFVVRAQVARECRMINDMALVGFCEDVRAHGYNIYCDSRERVVHP